MGTAAPALVLIGVALGAHVAQADSCTGISSEGGRFAACFDPGNRLTLSVGTEGYGGGVSVRHTIDFEDEPDLVWKMDHSIVQIQHGLVDGEVDGLLYRGRFLRHSRDGHIVLPIGANLRKIFLPFDIGALVEVGRLHLLRDERSELSVVETALLVDLARTRDFRTRFALGPVASWDVAFDHGAKIAVADQRVAPFSALLADLHFEDRSGLTLLDLRGVAGTAWHTDGGWTPRVRAEAMLERVVFAVNDRPVALYANALYDSDSGEAVAGIGLRAVLVQRHDPRVSLHPPAVAVRAPTAPARD